MKKVWNIIPVQIKNRTRLPSTSRLAALAAAAFLLAAPAGQAALMSADYLAPGDGLLTRDTQTGLDWLDLTQTYGRSASEAAALTAPSGSFPGFRLATPAEFASLYANAGLTYSVYDGSPNATDPAFLSRARGLQNLLGYDTPFSSPSTIINYITAGFLNGPYYANFGLIAVYDFAPGQGTDYYRAESYGVGTFTASYVGLYLVRDTPAPPTSVPESGNTAVLAGLAGLGLALLRRHRV